MSGIEVAGLVLAAIPLIIAALEHYDKITDPKYIFFQFQGQLGKATRKLRVQHTLYEQSIETLLLPITSEDERAEMIDNSSSKLWSDPELDEDLRKRLGRSYIAYMQTVETIQSTMVDIAGRLEGVKGAEEVTKLGLRAIIEKHAPAKVSGQLSRQAFGAKVKFTMKRRRIKEVLNELQEHIDSIERFQTKADTITALTEPDTQAGAKQTFKLSTDTIRDNMRKLHEVLTRTWCSSAHDHRAGLLLEHRLVKKKRQIRTVGSAPKIDRSVNCFGVSFCRSAVSEAKAWVDTEIRIIESQAEAKATSKVTIVAPDDASSGATASLAVVTDVCALVIQPRHSCLGFHIQGETLLGTYQAVTRYSYANQSVTLKELVHQGTYSRGIGSNLRDSYELSITLVSSLIQLSHTPWLSDNWTKENIIFLRYKAGGCSNAIDIKHPYLVREHVHPCPITLSTPTRQRTDAENLAALGVILVELCHGYAIESLITEEDKCLNNKERTNVFAALRILNSVGRDWMGSQRQAIQFCLECVTKPNASMLDLDFAKAIEHQVLAPLQQDLDILLAMAG